MRLLFVCTGNICRSPTAEAVLRHKAAAAGLHACLSIDSAGTRDWNLGLPPSRLAVECGADKGYDLTGLRARQIAIEDFADFDRIYVMDRSHLRELLGLKPERSIAEVRLFLHDREVADPYGGTRADYERALALIEDGAEAILEELTATLASTG